MRMRSLAEPALDEVLSQMGLSKSGLFLMAHPKAIELEGKGTFELAFHRVHSDVPIVKARVIVDAFSGEVNAEAFASGVEPWSPPQ